MLKVKSLHLFHNDECITAKQTQPIIIVSVKRKGKKNPELLTYFLAAFLYTQHM